MKSFTIHKLDDDLANSLEKRAKREGLSINQTVKVILSESLGLKKRPAVDHSEDFADLAGRWSDKEAETFDQRIAEESQVHPGDWER